MGGGGYGGPNTLFFFVSSSGASGQAAFAPHLASFPTSFVGVVFVVDGWCTVRIFDNTISAPCSNGGEGAPILPEPPFGHIISRVYSQLSIPEDHPRLVLKPRAWLCQFRYNWLSLREGWQLHELREVARKRSHVVRFHTVRY